MTQNIGNRPHDAERSKSSPGFFSDELEDLLRCTRCDLPYQAMKSTSGLRLTYCSFLCELGDLGFSMAGLEHMERDASKVSDASKGSDATEELAEPTPAEPTPAE